MNQLCCHITKKS
uniref:Uncharacterized protein n=1 Tax=Rhizophora mucronata TaxID=61149 RepID=A0A2P2PBG7_RHIMU